MDEKIRVFLATLDAPRKPNGYPKILCYLVYRHLDHRPEWRPVPIARVLAAIALQVVALEGAPVGRGRQIWLQSLRMAQCYAALLDDRDLDRAVAMAVLSIAFYSARFNPGGIVNVLRALALWAAIDSRAGHPLEALLVSAERHFKEAIPNFPLFGEKPAAPWLVACLEHSARALQILSILETKKMTLERAAKIEPVEPFCTAFKVASGLL